MEINLLSKKQYLEKNEVMVLLAAFGNVIRVRPFPFSFALTDICPSVRYPMRRRKSPLWQGVKDFQKKNGFKTFKFYVGEDPNKNQSV